ncbi:MAG: hypothetical protein AAFX87_01370 [Bacteroidota bacterium]
MNKMRNTLVALLIVIGSTAAVSAGDASGNKFGLKVLSTKSSSIYKVIFKGPSEENIKIKLFDEKEQTLYTKTFKHADGFIQPFDLANLPNGEYTFKVTTGGETYEEVITVTEQEQIHDLVEFDLTQGYKSCQLITNNTSDAALEVTIYDADGRLLLNDNLDASSRLNRVYDFSKSFSREVTFVISQDGNTIKETSFNF